jgi:hypothetical protein
MSANASFIAAMVSLAVWTLCLYGVGVLFNWWEARTRARRNQKQ